MSCPEIVYTKSNLFQDKSFTASTTRLERLYYRPIFLFLLSKLFNTHKLFGFDCN